jgi:two-component system CheB/CheR fusion protein
MAKAKGPGKKKLPMREVRAQSEASGGRRWLEGIVEMAGDAVIGMDAGQRVILFNAEAERMLFCSKADAIDSSVERFIPERFRVIFGKHWQRIGSTGHPPQATRVRGMMAARRGDGGEIPVEASIAKAGAGRKANYTLVLRDVSERVRLENEVLENGLREQQRIGQELHDDLCQQLVATEFLTSVLAKELARESAAKEAQAVVIVECLRRALVATRFLARGLASPIVAREGLASALRWLATNTAEVFHVRCSYDGPEAMPIKEELAGLHLYRIAQEAISNAVRHGKAREIGVKLQAKDGYGTLIIRDNGSGFLPASSATVGIGVDTMRYRAVRIGGTLEIRPRRQGGTEVVCTFPSES